ncbi:MAG: T9SS type A sorting domain-containing protein [Flavobacterium sp.]|nr:T9SS type A sorting domain-containing protein [Flavobacterium sp.]
MLNNEFTKEMVVAFNANATDGYDLGKDAKSPVNNLVNDTYFPLDGKNEYVISTLPFDIEKRIPIALKCNSRSSFKITVGSLINFDLAENIFIHDKLTGTYHDIKNGYYDVTIDSESKDRFEITFKNPSLTTADAEVLKSFTVFQNNESNELVISNAQLIDMKSCYVYDILGKVIFSKEKLGSNSQYLFPTSSLSDGVYIVKLKTSNNLEVNKKVIVKKK